MKQVITEFHVPNPQIPTYENHTVPWRKCPPLFLVIPTNHQHCQLPKGKDDLIMTAVKPTTYQNALS
jgi:hypothetical protein